MNAPARRAAVIANLVLSTVNHVVGIAGQLLLVPAFLRAWGEQTYGDWLTLSAMSAYFSLTDLGMQTYVVNRLTGEVVRGKSDEFETTFHSAILLYAIVSGIALTVLVGLGFVLPWERWFAGRAITGHAVIVVSLLLGSGIISSVWSGFAGALYRVFGEPQRSSAVGAVQRIASLSATLGVLAAGATPSAMAASQLAVSLIATTWVVVDVRRRHPQSALSLRAADVKVALGMLPPSSLFAVVGVANGLTVQGSVLITSAVLGPLAVTVFSTSRTLANAVKQFVSLLGYVAWPEFTRMEAGGATHALASSFWLLLKASSLLTIWIVSSLWFTGGAVHELWTGGHAHFDLRLFRLLLCHAFLMTPSWGAGVLLASTNRHRALSLLYLLQGVLTIALFWTVLPALGLAGAGVALLFAEFPLFGYLVPRWSLAVIGKKFSAFAVEIYLKSLPIFGAAFAAAALANSAGTSPAWSIVLAVAVTAVPVFAGAFLWMRADERALVLGVLRNR